jgi:hypothetical protein
MHAYPVAGTQIAWGTFLWIPLAAAGLHDACEFLRREKRGFAAKACRLGNSALILLSLLAISRFALLGWDRHRSGEPLDLPGARDLILPEDFTSALRILTANASLHGDMLFSIPGMFSLNLWSGLPAPRSQTPPIGSRCSQPTARRRSGPAWKPIRAPASSSSARCTIS